MSTDSSTLRIAVVVKQVPDVNAVTVDPVTHEARLGDERIMNTYDSYAVGEAIGLQERFGAHVTIVTAGAPSARDVLLRALATGADEAILIDLSNHNEIDSLATARAIAAELAKHNFDLVLAGQSTDDYETGQVGPQIAESLHWPHVSLVTHVEIEDRALRIKRDAEATKEVISVALPAVLMVLSGREGPQRYPTLRGMMAAKKKDIPVVPGVADDARRLSWTTPRAVERDATGIIVQGVPAEQAAADLVSWLKEQKLI